MVLTVVSGPALVGNANLTALARVLDSTLTTPTMPKSLGTDARSFLISIVSPDCETRTSKVSFPGRRTCEPIPVECDWTSAAGILTVCLRPEGV